MEERSGSIGQVIAARREALGITQRELARRAGLEPGTVGYWERGRISGVIPDPPVVHALARALGCTVTELVVAAGYDLEQSDENDLSIPALEARMRAIGDQIAAQDPEFSGWWEALKQALNAVRARVNDAVK